MIATQAGTLTEFLEWARSRGRLLPLFREYSAEQLVLAAARDRGLSVSDPELQAGADAFRRRHGLNTVDGAHQWLEAHGLSVLDLQDAVENELLLEKFKDLLLEEGGKSHYLAESHRYSRVKLRRLVAPSEGVARELLHRVLMEGAEFAELARCYNVDSTSRAASGDLGVLARWQLPESLSELVFESSVNGVIGPIAADGGYALFLVEGFIASAFDAITQAKIRDELFNRWLDLNMQDVRIDRTSLSSGA